MATTTHRKPVEVQKVIAPKLKEISTRGHGKREESPKGLKPKKHQEEKKASPKVYEKRRKKKKEKKPRSED